MAIMKLKSAGDSCGDWCDHTVCTCHTVTKPFKSFITEFSLLYSHQIDNYSLLVHINKTYKMKKIPLPPAQNYHGYLLLFCLTTYDSLSAAVLQPFGVFKYYCVSLRNKLRRMT